MHASIADEEENTTELKFGDVDFSQVQCLTNDEMYLLLTKRQAHGFTNELVNQTYGYLEKVTTTSVMGELEPLTAELDQKVRRLNLKRIADGKLVPLHAFETASLANLVKDEETSSDEVLSLIPSMSRFPMDQVEIAIRIVVDAKSKIEGGV